MSHQWGASEGKRKWLSTLTKQVSHNNQASQMLCNHKSRPPTWSLPTGLSFDHTRRGRCCAMEMSHWHPKHQIVWGQSSSMVKMTHVGDWTEVSCTCLNQYSCLNKNSLFRNSCSWHTWGSLNHANSRDGCWLVLLGCSILQLVDRAGLPWSPSFSERLLHPPGAGRRHDGAGRLPYVMLSHP